MEKFAPHQKLSLDTSRGRIRNLQIKSINDASLKLKPNKRGIKKINLENMETDSGLDIDMIYIYGQRYKGLLTIHIPSLHPSTTEESIKKTFKELGFGEVSHAEIVRDIKTKGFVHVRNPTEEFSKIYKYLWSKDQAQVKIFINQKNYWYFRRVDNSLVDVHSKPFILEWSDSDSD